MGGVHEKKCDKLGENAGTKTILSDLHKISGSWRYNSKCV